MIRWLLFRIACFRFGWCPQHRVNKRGGEGWPCCEVCDGMKWEERKAKRIAAELRYGIKQEQE